MCSLGLESEGEGGLQPGNYVLTLTTLDSSAVSLGFILEPAHFSFPLEQGLC